MKSRLKYPTLKNVYYVKVLQKIVKMYFTLFDTCIPCIGYYYFVEKLKIVEKQLCKLNCSYGKVSHVLKSF